MKRIKPISFTLPSAHKCDGIAFVSDVGVFIMETKKCTKCGEFKLLSEFYKNKSKKYGLEYFCKECFNKNITKYIRTKKGLITKIYGSQKTNSKKRNYCLPTYTKQELKDWLFSQDLFHELFNNWVKSGYRKDLIPSIDRPDDYISYTLDNIQLMTWGENKKKGHLYQKSGINNKANVPIVQYDLENIFIQEFHSAYQAERITKINSTNICTVCNKNRKTAGGFKWKYKNKQL